MAARRRPKTSPEDSPAENLQRVVQQALDVAKKARKHRKNLAGDNYYANKLADLRADATNTFREFSAGNAGDVTAMAEMIQGIFAPDTSAKDRALLSRELLFSLRTTWKKGAARSATAEPQDLFPPSILAQAKRGYLVTVGRQMNGAFSEGWYDACLVMMRRILEISIIEAFEAHGIFDQIKDANGNYVHLSDLIARALAEPSWTLSRNTRKHLPTLRDLGHMSAHGRYFTGRREDVEGIRNPCRVVIEEFLHHAQLL